MSFSKIKKKYEHAKAFDSLDRSTLLRKLLHCGITEEALKWFKSYFFLNKVFVIYKNAKSELLSVSFGVPQGSIVGPILIIHFMNDIVYSAPSVKTDLFAHDTNLFLTASDPARVVHETNMTLSNIELWFKIN